MQSSATPIGALPAWCLLNDVTFSNCDVRNIPSKGLGLIAAKPLAVANDTNPSNVPPLLIVPHGLVLNAEAVEQHAKKDKDFRQLLDAVGRQSPRKDILLFLLVQLAINRGEKVPGVRNPWTDYIAFLPRQILLPTLWQDEERLQLQGTSLEVAVNAKRLALDREFDNIRDKSSALPVWNDALWIENAVTVQDWYLVDAWYRSRCLELPSSGEAMVPCLDMVNHAAIATAYYEESSRDEVVLRLRSGASVSTGDEAFINYGENKSAAEMLFSYGFIDDGPATKSLVLPLQPLAGDPLASAKAFVSGGSPTVRVFQTADGEITWESSSAFLMCLNEEDGLEFGFLQDADGNQQLRVFWQEVDVTDSVDSFESLVQGSDLTAVYRLRVVTIVQQSLSYQLQRMQSVMSVELPASSTSMRAECFQAASRLRKVETELLGVAVEALESEKAQLFADKAVVAYLGPMEISESDLVGDEAANEEDDFS